MNIINNNHEGKLRVLVVAPFVHQNGHFVTLPRDISCALASTGHQVTLLHARPFQINLDWFGSNLERICLLDLLKNAPRWWRELWPRLAENPSNQCLAWILWKLHPLDYDLVLWTDFQAQGNVWPLTIARGLHFYQFKTAFIEHHPPDRKNAILNLLPKTMQPHRLRLLNQKMVVFSRALQEQWSNQIGTNRITYYVPYGVWPKKISEEIRIKARKELSISDQDRVLLIFGVQASKRKHLDTLAQAAKNLRIDKPLVMLFIGATLGNSPHPFSNWHYPGIETRVENGFIPENRVAQYFASADMVWTNYRNFPGASGALLQSMGFGRISLCSTDGEIGDLCRENHLGLIVKTGKVTDLENALCQFVSMQKSEQLSREQNINKVAQEFSWPKITQKLLHNLGIET